MSKLEQSLNYDRIEKAIKYIIENHTKQLKLEEIANHINLSSFHFQRLFHEWAGTTPKKFLQYISLSHAKEKLVSNSIYETTHALGLSSTSRLHELFVTIEAMTPAEYKNGGASLAISYSLHQSPFGSIVIASTDKGICQITFLEDHECPLKVLKQKFANAQFIQQEKTLHTDVLNIFSKSETNSSLIKTHLKGSDFQLKVWEALLKIPKGHLCTYGDIATEINQPNASRAVGTAIGANPLAYLIPCHRVIQATGLFGGYRWSPIRKTAIIGWESTI